MRESARALVFCGILPLEITYGPRLESSYELLSVSNRAAQRNLPKPFRERLDSSDELLCVLRNAYQTKLTR